MEFPFSVTKAIQADQDGFAILRSKRTSYRRTGSSVFDGVDQSNPLDSIIDRMGHASSKAQKLPSVITTAGKFFNSGDNIIYMKAEGNKAIGFIKTGRRTLFQRLFSGDIKEIKPLCVLDFYVHESVQRGGQGKQLFDLMLKECG